MAFNFVQIETKLDFIPQLPLSCFFLEIEINAYSILRLKNTDGLIFWLQTFRNQIMAKPYCYVIISL